MCESGMPAPSPGGPCRPHTCPADLGASPGLVAGRGWQQAPWGPAGGGVGGEGVGSAPGRGRSTQSGFLGYQELGARGKAGISSRGSPLRLLRLQGSCMDEKRNVGAGGSGAGCRGGTDRRF